MKKDKTYNVEKFGCLKCPYRKSLSYYYDDESYCLFTYNTINVDDIDKCPLRFTDDKRNNIDAGKHKCYVLKKDIIQNEYRYRKLFEQIEKDKAELLRLENLYY